MITLVNEYEAVVDTCALAPMPLCDTLLRMAEEPSIFVPRWSRHILEELHRVLTRFGYSTEQADRRIRVMSKHFEEAEICGYEDLISSMTTPDEDDRHVLAAAVRGGVQAIITSNVKHFPASSIAQYGIEILTPDEFPVHQYHLNSGLVMEKLDAQAQQFPERMKGLLTRLGAGAPAFVDLIYKEVAA